MLDKKQKREACSRDVCCEDAAAEDYAHHKNAVLSRRGQQLAGDAHDAEDDFQVIWATLNQFGGGKEKKKQGVMEESGCNRTGSVCYLLFE